MMVPNLRSRQQKKYSSVSAMASFHVRFWNKNAEKCIYIKFYAWLTHLKAPLNVFLDLNVTKCTQHTFTFEYLCTIKGIFYILEFKSRFRRRCFCIEAESSVFFTSFSFFRIHIKIFYIYLLSGVSCIYTSVAVWSKLGRVRGRCHKIFK